MKVYGWNDTGPLRGEILAAEAASCDIYFGNEMLAGELGWEKAFTSFSECRRTLLKEMQDQGAGTEQIAAVRNMKAWHVPVTEVIE